MEVIEQELYGGAITMNLPRKFGTIRYKSATQHARKRRRGQAIHRCDPMLSFDTCSPFANKDHWETSLLSLQICSSSHVREVPDHQEVFVNVDEDQSVIVEILELAAEATDDSCAV